MLDNISKISFGKLPDENNINAWLDSYMRESEFEEVETNCCQHN